MNSRVAERNGFPDVERLIGGAIFLDVADLRGGQVNERVAKLTVGKPEDDAAVVPVVSESSAKFVEGLVKDAQEKGATLCQEYKREVRQMPCCLFAPRVLGPFVSHGHLGCGVV